MRVFPGVAHSTPSISTSWTMLMQDAAIYYRHEAPAEFAYE